MRLVRWLFPIVFLLVLPLGHAVAQDPSVPVVSNDGCEPNETQESACALTLNARSPEWSLPPGDEDWLVLDGPDLPALTLTLHTSADLPVQGRVLAADGSVLFAAFNGAQRQVTLNAGYERVFIHLQNLTLDRDGSYQVEVQPLAPTATPVPATATSALPTTTLAPDRTPDGCEPNDTPDTACRLAPDAVSDLLTLLPADDQDYFVVNASGRDGLVPQVSVAAAQGLALVVSVSRVSDGQLLATIEPPATSVFLPPGLDGDILLHVQSRSVLPDQVGAYRLEFRRVLPTVTPTVTPWPTGTPAPTATPEPTSTPKPSATATPLVDERPDGCEPNNDFDHACELGLNTVSGQMTLLPTGDQDVYAVNLGEAVGVAPVLTLRSTSGLDLALTVYDAETFTPLATLEDPATSLTLPADLVGWVYLLVQSQGLGEPTGMSYRLEVQRMAEDSLPQPAGNAIRPDGATLPWPPDDLENNWSDRTAAEIAIGELYRLNFVCPVPGKCEGGDHDWLWTKVTAGVPYDLATYDLAPGADTVLHLFLPTETGLLNAAAVDDFVPQASGLSALYDWVAPANGVLYLQIAPRQGFLPKVNDGTYDSSYTFQMARSDSPEAAALRAAVAAQAPLPTATPAPTVAPPAPPPASNPPPPDAPPPAPTVVPPPAEAPNGDAVVIEPTGFYVTPGEEEANLITMLPEGSRVTLLGQAAGLWVLVSVPGEVVTGWVSARALQRIGGEPGTPAASGAPPSTTVTATQVATVPTAAPPDFTVEVSPPEPLPSPPELPPSAAINRQVEVTVVQVWRTMHLIPGQPTPVPNPKLVEGGLPLAGMRVQLVNAWGEVFTEAVTAEDGRVTLAQAVPPGMALWVQLPAVGLRTLVPGEQSKLAAHLTIALPGREG
jgi:hypothetical protein